MFKKSAAALRAQALATETKAEKAIAKAQADQIKAVKQ